MMNQLPKTLPILFFVFFTTFLHAQKGTVNGVLKDKEGFPLPGVSIIIQNTTIGVNTDFDGNYSIECNIGDTLVFSSVGMTTRRVIVTNEMFGLGGGTTIAKKIEVKTIKSTAYEKALKTIESKIKIIPNISASTYTYNKEKGNFKYHRIKEIELRKDSMAITYFKPDVFWEVGYNTGIGFQFVKKDNLPELQTSYSQGAVTNGSLAFQGPETGTIFSYGPRINNLVFDGSAYEYDSDGRLVPLGSGNGITAKRYINNIFDTSLKSSHHLFFNIATDVHYFGFDYTNKGINDIYNIEKSTSNNLTLQYKNKKHGIKELGWNTFLKYGNHINNQPNINGFQNNVLLNNWVTPITFNNQEGVVLENNTQRSFSPNTFNNPYWLLEKNKNSEKNTSFISSIQNNLKLTEQVNFNTKLNYNNTINTQVFGLPKNTIGFENGYISTRELEKKTFNGVLNFNFQDATYDEQIKIISASNYTFEDVDYTLNQATGFEDFSFTNSQNTAVLNNSLQRHSLRLLNKINYSFYKRGIDLSFTNNSYISSVQTDKWFLPTLQVKLDLEDILDIYFFNEFSIGATTSIDVNDVNLVYSNKSHNSLNNIPSESLRYLATNDLFLNSTLKLEEKENYELYTNIRFPLLGGNFDFGVTYFNTTTKNNVFPVFENNEFQLKNVAAIVNKGLEAELSANIRISYDFRYIPTFTFSTNRTKVLELRNEAKRIPIAGFSSISKNLIEGESAGVIVGSAYLRNEENNLVIDENGYPIVSDIPKIIGDPTPDFNIGFSNRFKWNDLELDVVVDYQKGGDVWNGTQNVLNYIGMSQESAIDRNTTSFIFSGVNEQGEKNTIPVDFYNTNNDVMENRFTRYGFEGVAEDAIVDGSYVNLKHISISYKPIRDRENQFIRDLQIAFYASNLFTWSKFKGATPYSNLYGNNAANGLNFFNAPVVSEIGFTINIKI